MKKKLLGIFVCMLLIVSIQSVLGEIENTELIKNESVGKQSGDGDIIDMINQVNESLLFYYLEGLVEIGPRYTGTENCSKAAQYIYDEFKKMDLWVQFDDWEYKGFNSRNVVATLNGTDSTSDAIFIICAHYDTTQNSPGATDNGVGVATVLASAWIMSQHSFNHTVRFIAFSGEEVGLYGSYCYAKEAYWQGDNIVAVLNVDENGYAVDENGKRVLVQRTVAVDWISLLCVDICTMYKDIIDLSVIPIPYFPTSDHAPFYNYGYGALYYVTFDWETPWLHSPDDTLDKVNKTYHVKNY